MCVICKTSSNVFNIVRSFIKFKINKIKFKF